MQGAQADGGCPTDALLDQAGLLLLDEDMPSALVPQEPLTELLTMLALPTRMEIAAAPPGPDGPALAAPHPAAGHQQPGPVSVPMAQLRAAASYNTGTHTGYGADSTSGHVSVDHAAPSPNLGWSSAPFQPCPDSAHTSATAHACSNSAGSSARRLLAGLTVSAAASPLLSEPHQACLGWGLGAAGLPEWAALARGSDTAGLSTRPASPAAIRARLLGGHGSSNYTSRRSALNTLTLNDSQHDATSGDGGEPWSAWAPADGARPPPGGDGPASGGFAPARSLPAALRGAAPQPRLLQGAAPRMRASTGGAASGHDSGAGPQMGGWAQPHHSTSPVLPGAAQAQAHAGQARAQLPSPLGAQGAPAGGWQPQHGWHAEREQAQHAWQRGQSQRAPQQPQQEPPPPTAQASGGWQPQQPAWAQQRWSSPLN
ncbi:hypothetical protein HYH03_011036 [Edaphochlamys debaryana]|nr:hypothetical protein HYH03_011036 [Edaphochlamys debaryana]|eukprot:KAG2490646.1 hypothetical protein HYH03_011036 [Edaphochlamys debaryana]